MPTPVFAEKNRTHHRVRARPWAATKRSRHVRSEYSGFTTILLTQAGTCHERVFTPTPCEYPRVSFGIRSDSFSGRQAANQGCGGGVIEILLLLNVLLQAVKAKDQELDGTIGEDDTWFRGSFVPII
jgi:hypothetical protein